MNEIASSDEIRTLADTVAAYLKGKRLAAFEASIDVVIESMEQGGWLPRGHQRAAKGIKGITTPRSTNQPATRYNDDARSNALFRCYMATIYGATLRQAELDVVTDDDLASIAPKVPVGVVRGWLRLKVALHGVYEDLDASRPLPVYTEIGLSRKVTATLQDANLDLDLTTRRLCPLGWRWGKVYNKHGQVVTRRDGTPVLQKIYFPKWPKDTIFGASRFNRCDCEACGKTIPSGLVVPILISDTENRVLGFWFGRDCARNILGIKDAGISRGAEQ